MNAIWDKFKWLFTHLSWVLAGLIIAIDPKHIDKLAEQHPVWSGLIVGVWAVLMAWANKTKSEPSGLAYPPGTGANPLPPKQGPYTGGLR